VPTDLEWFLKYFSGNVRTDALSEISAEKMNATRAVPVAMYFELYHPRQPAYFCGHCPRKAEAKSQLRQVCPKRIVLEPLPVE
jgi:hypothetical protein